MNPTGASPSPGLAGATFGVSILSSIIGGVGSYEKGQQEKQADDYNAQITLQNMRDQMIASQQQFSTLRGKQASGYAASGVDIASGSPLLIMAATSARGGQQGEQIEQAGTEEADLQRYYGKLAAFQGTMGGIGSFLQGISQSSTAYYGATRGLPNATPPASRPSAGSGDPWDLDD